MSWFPNIPAPIVSHAAATPADDAPLGGADAAVPDRLARLTGRSAPLPGPSAAANAGSSGAATTAAPARARADVPYSELPADLKQALSHLDWPDKWWNGLSQASRQNLVAIYNRMQDHGLWRHVERIVKVVDPERPVLGMRPPGNSGSVEFLAKDGSRLLHGSLDTGKFGLDPGFLALLHPGQQSLREWSSTSDGLHLSIGAAGAFDAHLDRVSPTNRPDASGRTQIDMQRSGKHWQQEVLPDLIRNGIPGVLPGTGIPGVVLGVGPHLANKPLPHPDPTHDQPQNGLPPILGSAMIVLNTQSDDRRTRTLVERPTAPATRDVDDALLKRVADAVSSNFATNALAAPSAGLANDDPNPVDLATDLASRFAYAARHGMPTIEVDFKGQYAGATEADRKAIAAEVKRIAATVAAEMKQAEPSVAGIGVRVRFDP